jgi:hypothetical protein
MERERERWSSRALASSRLASRPANAEYGPPGPAAQDGPSQRRRNGRATRVVFLPTRFHAGARLQGWQQEVNEVEMAPSLVSSALIQECMQAIGTSKCGG